MFRLKYFQTEQDSIKDGSSLPSFIALFCSFIMLNLSMLTPAHSASLVIGDNAPNFTLKSLAGPNLRLSEQRGKVVVLSFWANWCGSCQPHIKALNELVKIHKDKGVILWVISLDNTRKPVAKAAQALSLSAEILLDQRQDIAERYFVDELPTTIMIDRDGNIRFTHVDFHARDENLYRQELLQLATE